MDHAALLRDARLLGAELDTRYRVLGLTVEVGPAAAAAAGLGGTDPRLLVVLHPVGWFRATLVVEDPDDPRVEAFDTDQLVDVVHALDGPVLTGPVLERDDARAAVESLPASLEGTTSTVDGRSRAALVDVRSGNRRLLLAAGYDEVVVRDTAGNDLPGQAG